MRKPIQPPAYFIILVVLSILTYFIMIKIISSPYNYSGSILILFGIIINLWTDHLFKKAKTEVKYHKIPSKLLTSGPFKISRNPMYLGMLIILLGIAIILGNLITFIFPLIFVAVINNKYLPVEEKNMEKTFGKKYKEYKNKVRRWI
jgi:protein-S-isoprenylcysteine O-methyltransferase Ste14